MAIANISDVESAFLTGNALVQQWQQEFLQQFYEPYQRMALASWWKSIPQDKKDLARINTPQAFDRVDNAMQSLVGGGHDDNLQR